MAKIWANCLIASKTTWSNVPNYLQDAVIAELNSRVESGKISADLRDEIIGA